MGLIDDLGAGPIGPAPDVFIYFVEEHAEFLALVEPVFVGLDEGRWSAVTSSLTLFETLVVPYHAGDTALAERYEALLSRSRGFRLVELDRSLLRAAAHLRAAVSVNTPDAIQLAAVLGARCTVFVTNDRELPLFLASAFSSSGTTSGLVAGSGNADPSPTRPGASPRYAYHTFQFDAVPKARSAPSVHRSLA